MNEKTDIVKIANHVLFQLHLGEMYRGIEGITELTGNSDFGSAKEVMISYHSNYKSGYDGIGNNGFVGDPVLGQKAIEIGSNPLARRQNGRYSYDEIGLSLYALKENELMQQLWFKKVVDNGSDVAGGRIEDETTYFGTRRTRRFVREQGIYTLVDEEKDNFVFLENVKAFKFTSQSGLSSKENIAA